MKTRKTRLFGMALMAMAMLAASGCSKSDDNGNNGGGYSPNTTQLSGVRAADPKYDTYYECNYRYPVLEFANSNTIIEYANVFDDYVSSLSTHSFPDHSGWYYGNKTTITYTFVDNKVYLTNGDIYTFMDGKLYKDNSSTVLTSWTSGSNNGNLSQQDEELTNKLKNTTWRYVKHVTYYKNTGRTETDTNQYGTVSFRSSFSGSSSVFHVLTVNGKAIGEWWISNGRLCTGLKSNAVNEFTDESIRLFLKIINASIKEIEQLSNNSLVLFDDGDNITDTYYYSAE